MRPTGIKQEFNLEEFFSSDVTRFTESLSAIEADIDPEGPPDSEEVLQQLIEAIHASREACRLAGMELYQDPDRLKASQARFRDTIAPWFDQSWFMRHAKSKPRGYAGDFQMLTAIYEGLPRSSGIGGYLDAYFLRSDLARAVRARLEAIQKFLISETLRRTETLSILDVASGPGQEFATGFKSPRTVSLKCVDIDQDALDYLRDRIDSSGGASLDLSCYRYNALRMISPEQNLKTFGECDIIYSVGLCDYIPDRQMIAILKGWRESVSPVGIIYVAFKDCTRYVAAEYQWHVDWHFYERTASDCRELFAAAGYDVDAMEMFRDESGIIMNFVARQAALRRTRIDAAQRLAGPHFRTDGTDELDVASPAAPDLLQNE